MTVTPAPLTITANGVSRESRCFRSTLGVTYSGFVNGETSERAGRYVVGCRLGRGHDDSGGQLLRCDHGFWADLDELYDHLRLPAI